MHTVDFTALRSVTNPIFYPLYWNDDRFLFLWGGRGSGKSTFAAQKIIRRIILEPQHRIVCFRKVARTLRNSVFSELKGIIYQWNLKELFGINKSDMSIECKPNGNEILCLGTDDPEKLKSLSRVSSIWIEEATELSYDDFHEINMTLRGRRKAYKQIMLTFNPVSKKHWIKERFFDTNAEQSGGHRKITRHHSSYRDNLWIDREYIAELEGLKDIDMTLYKIHALGIWGTLEHTIYNNWITIDFNYLTETYPTECYGLDFGYENPTALIHIGFKDVEPIQEVEQTTKQSTIQQTAQPTEQEVTDKQGVGSETPEREAIKHKYPPYSAPVFLDDDVYQSRNFPSGVKSSGIGKGNIPGGLKSSDMKEGDIPDNGLTEKTYNDLARSDLKLFEKSWDCTKTGIGAESEYRSGLGNNGSSESDRDKSQDKKSLKKSKLRRRFNAAFLTEVFVERHLTNSQIIARLKIEIPESKRKKVIIYADSAEPDRIEEIRMAGFKIEPADKSVEDGILSVKEKNLYIDKKSTILISEIEKYKRREDKDGNVLEEPAKYDDHTMDAMRYGIHTHMKKFRKKGRAKIYVGKIKKTEIVHTDM